MNSYDTRGRLVAQVFFTELEKISASRTQKIVDVVLQNRELARQLEPDLVEKLRPGTGSFLYALLDRRAARKIDSSVADRGLSELDEMRRKLMKNLESTNDQRRRNRILNRLIEIKGAQQQVRSGRAKFDWNSGAPSPSPIPVTPPPPVAPPVTPPVAPPVTPPVAFGPSGARNIAFGAGLGAAGLLGTQYYMNQPESPQY